MPCPLQGVSAGLSRCAGTSLVNGHTRGSIPDSLAAGRGQQEVSAVVHTAAAADFDPGFDSVSCRFDHTPLATPNGDILIRELSFEVSSSLPSTLPFSGPSHMCLSSVKVRSGTNVLVCGPNGCGKSSLFRALGEVSSKRVRARACVCFYFWESKVVLCVCTRSCGPCLGDA